MICKIDAKAVFKLLKGVAAITTFLYLIVFHTLVFSQNAVVVKYETNIIIENSGQLEEQVRFIIQINDRSGEDYHNFKIRYNEGDKIKDLEAWIEDANGTFVKKLKYKDVKDRSVFEYSSFHTDDYIRYFSLTHSKYPYTLHINYSHKYAKFLHIENWSPGFYQNIPTLEARLKITVPNDYPISIENKNIDPPQINETEDYIQYVWQSAYLDIFTNEKMSPDEDDLMPQVVVVPINFDYGLTGQFLTWETYGKWQYRMIEGLDKLTDSEFAKIDELTNGVSDDLEKAKILYRYLQENTRYVNVSIDVGGLKPYPASYVAINKYGDCKALTNYMKTLLQEVGITAYYTNIYAGDIPVTINKDFPSQQFNHVILMVPIKSDTIWLECTSDTAPFGYLGTFTQNRDAFVIKKDSSCFVKTPALDTNMVLENYSTRITFDLAYNCTAKAHITFCGGSYEDLAYIDKHFIEDDKKKALAKFINFRNYDITDWKILTDTNGKAKAEAWMTYELANCLKSQSGFVYSPLPRLNSKLFQLKKQRQWPLVLMYPVNISDSIFISYKHPYEATVRENVSIKSDFGYYHLNYHISDSDELIVSRKLVIYPGRFEGSDYSGLKSFLDTIKSTESKNPLLLNNAL